MSFKDELRRAAWQIAHTILARELATRRPTRTPGGRLARTARVVPAPPRRGRPPKPFEPIDLGADPWLDSSTLWHEASGPRRQAAALQTKQTIPRRRGMNGSGVAPAVKAAPVVTPKAPVATDNIAPAGGDPALATVPAPAPAPVPAATNGAGRRGRRLAWTRERVVSELGTWLIEVPDLDAAFLTRRNQAPLVSAARRIFGRFEAALNAANLHLSVLYPDGPPSKRNRVPAVAA